MCPLGSFEFGRNVFIFNIFSDGPSGVLPIAAVFALWLDIVPRLKLFFFHLLFNYSITASLFGGVLCGLLVLLRDADKVLMPIISGCA